MTIKEDNTSVDTKALFDFRFHRFKSKTSTQQTIPLKIYKFRFINTGEPQPNASGMSGYMEYSIQVAKICSVILDESISSSQQVLSVFKSVLHHSLIKNIKSAGLIFPSKEINFVVFHQINTKTIIKEDMEQKRVKEERQMRN